MSPFGCTSHAYHLSRAFSTPNLLRHARACIASAMVVSNGVFSIRVT